MAINRRTQKFSVLMYHAVTGTAAGKGSLAKPQQRYAVSRETFAETLDMLPNVLDPALWDDYRENPEGGVMLTFDDALIHHVRESAPELAKRGLKAVFAAPSDHVGRSGMLTWDDLKSLADAGHTIAGHGKTHTLFEFLSPGEIKVELAESKSIIEERIGRPVRFVTLPGGSMTRATLDAAREAGYKAVFTSKAGLNHWSTDLFTVNRFAIRSGYSASRAAALAEGSRFAVCREKLRADVFGTVRILIGRKRYKKIHDGL
jgi:peptidoglycan/xylan/chitin deacetylase (PgdA/CDA1 family)